MFSSNIYLSNAQRQLRVHPPLYHGLLNIQLRVRPSATISQTSFINGKELHSKVLAKYLESRIVNC